MFKISYANGGTNNVTSFNLVRGVNTLASTCSFNINFANEDFDFPLGSEIGISQGEYDFFSGYVVSLGHDSEADEDTFLVEAESRASILVHSQTTASLFFEKGTALSDILNTFLLSNGWDTALIDKNNPLLTTVASCRLGSFVGRNAEQEILKFCNAVGLHLTVSDKGLIYPTLFNPSETGHHRINTSQDFFSSYESEFSSNFLNGESVLFVEGSEGRKYEFGKQIIENLKKSPIKVLHTPYRYSSAQATTILDFYNAYSSASATGATIVVTNSFVEGEKVKIGDTVTLSDETNGVDKNYTVVSIGYNQTDGDISTTYNLGTFGCLASKLNPMIDTGCIFKGFAKGVEL